VCFFDKSTNFGTEVEQYITNKYGCGAIGQLPSGGRGGHFPADTQKTTEVKVCCYKVLVNVS